MEQVVIEWGILRANGTVDIYRRGRDSEAWARFWARKNGGEVVRRAVIVRRGAWQAMPAPEEAAA